MHRQVLKLQCEAAVPAERETPQPHAQAGRLFQRANQLRAVAVGVKRREKDTRGKEDEEADGHDDEQEALHEGSDLISRSKMIPQIIIGEIVSKSAKSPW